MAGKPLRIRGTALLLVTREQREPSGDAGWCWPAITHLRWRPLLASGLRRPSACDSRDLRKDTRGENGHNRLHERSEEGETEPRTTSFGTKLSVCSWIDVAACTIPMITPMINIGISKGSETRPLTAIARPSSPKRMSGLQRHPRSRWAAAVREQRSVRALHEGMAG